MILTGAGALLGSAVLTFDDKGPRPYSIATLPALGNEIRLPEGEPITMLSVPALRLEKLN